MAYLGYGPISGRGQLSEDAEHYRRQAEEAEEQIERMRREKEEERENRQRELRERAEYNSRQAFDWPDALRKNAGLLRREAQFEGVEEIDKISQWFADGADACNRALEIWEETGETYAARILTLRALIEAEELQWRQAVARRLKAEKPESEGWQELALSLANPHETPSSMLDW